VINCFACLLIVAEIHEDLEKAKIDSRKDRIPPRAPRDKPTVVEAKDDILQYAILLSLFYCFYNVVFYQ